MISAGIDLEDVEFEYEFSGTQGFECRPDMCCGLCCGMPFNVTYHEINRINNFLRDWLLSARFRDFVLDHLTHLEVPIRIEPFHLRKEYEKYRKGFETFFKPSLFAAKDDVFYVTHYRLARHKDTGKCIFFDPTTYECAIYDSRPKECQVYPFNFDYNFRIDKRIKVFVTEECDGLDSAEPLNKPLLEEAIKDYIKLVFEQNKMLQKCGEKHSISVHMPFESFQEREIRKMRKERHKVAEMIEKIHITKKETKISEIRDILLEEQMISCLNPKSYKSYLSRLGRKEALIGDWI